MSCFIRFEKCAVAISPVDLGTLYWEDWTGLDWTGLVKRGLVKPGLVIKRGLVQGGLVKRGLRIGSCGRLFFFFFRFFPRL